MISTTSLGSPGVGMGLTQAVGECSSASCMGIDSCSGQEQVARQAGSERSKGLLAEVRLAAASRPCPKAVVSYSLIHRSPIHKNRTHTHIYIYIYK